MGNEKEDQAATSNPTPTTTSAAPAASPDALFFSCEPDETGTDSGSTPPGSDTQPLGTAEVRSQDLSTPAAYSTDKESSLVHDKVSSAPKARLEDLTASEVRLEDVPTVGPTPVTNGKAVDGGWGWVVVFGASLCHFFLLGVARSLGIIFILLREKFEATAAQTALVTAIFICIRSGGGPVASLLSNRFGCQKVAATGGLFLFVGIVSSAFASNLILVYLTFGVIAGIGAMMVYTPCYIIVSYWFDKHRGMAMSLSTVGTGLGNIAMAYLMATMAIEYQYGGSMIIVGALMLHNTVGSLLFLNPPNHKRKHKSLKDEEEKSKVKSQAIAEQIEQSNGYRDQENTYNSDLVKVTVLSNEYLAQHKKKSPAGKARSSCTSCINNSLWKNIPFLIHCCMMIGQQGCIQCVLLFLPSYARLELDCTPLQEAWLLAAFGAADLVGRFIFGFLFDIKIIRPRRVAAFMIVSILFAFFATTMALTSSYISLMIATAATALFEGGAHSQRATVVPNYVEPKQVSLAMGLLFLFMGIGNFYGPVAGGRLSDYTGTFKSSFVLSGCIYLCICTVNIINGFVYCWRHKK